MRVVPAGVTDPLVESDDGLAGTDTRIVAALATGIVPPSVGDARSLAVVGRAGDERVAFASTILTSDTDVPRTVMTLEDRDDLTATVDHTVVQDLIEEYDGYPAHVERTEGDAGGSGLLRLAFPDVESRDDDPNEDLTRLSWEEFFEEFDRERLAFVYPEDLGDDPAADFQLVERDRVEDAGMEV